LTAARAEIGVPFAVLTDLFLATPFVGAVEEGVEGVVGRAELRDVAPGGVAGVPAGDIRPEGPVVGGFRIFAVILCVGELVVGWKDVGWNV
jgi:hypothetical protein